MVGVWGQEGKMAAEIVGADREGPWRGAVAGDRRSPEFTGCKPGAQGGAVTPVFLQAGGDSSQSPPRHRPRGQPGPLHEKRGLLWPWGQLGTQAAGC